MTNTQPKKNKNKDWKEKFIKKHEILAVSDEFAIKVYNFAFPKNLIDFISQLLSELSSDFEECVGEDETEEDADYYLGHNEAKSEIKEKIKSVKDKWGL